MAARFLAMIHLPPTEVATCRRPASAFMDD